MEYQPGVQLDPRHQDELDHLKIIALQKLREASELISAYRAAYQARLELKYDDFENRVRDEFLMPMLLGAPGEQCEACGGSGRKKDR